MFFEWLLRERVSDAGNKTYLLQQDIPKTQSEHLICSYNLEPFQEWLKNFWKMGKNWAKNVRS